MVFVFLISAVVWRYDKYFSSRFLAHSVLRIDGLPESVVVVDRATFSWMDYRQEYALDVAPEHFSLLLEGRDYSARGASGTSRERSEGLVRHEAFDVTSCFRAGNFRTDGMVQICASLNKDEVVVIYDAE